MKDRIINYIETELLAGKQVKVTPQDDLLGSGLVDSMAIMRLISYLEGEFNLKIPPQDMVIENFMTVENIETYLQSRSVTA